MNDLYISSVIARHLGANVRTKAGQSYITFLPPNSRSPFTIGAHLVEVPGNKLGTFYLCLDVPNYCTDLNSINSAVLTIGDREGPTFQANYYTKLYQHIKDSIQSTDLQPWELDSYIKHKFIHASPRDRATVLIHLFNINMLPS